MSETSLERARAEAKRLIDTYQVEPLPAPIQSEINYILVAYDRRHTRPHPSLGSSAYYQ